MRWPNASKGYTLKRKVLRQLITGSSDVRASSTRLAYNINKYRVGIEKNNGIKGSNI